MERLTKKQVDDVENKSEINRVRRRDLRVVCRPKIDELRQPVTDQLN